MTYISCFSDFVISWRLLDEWMWYWGYIFSVTQTLTLKYVCRSVTYISWYSDSGLYLEYYLTNSPFSLDIGSVWHKDWPYKIYTAQWPIFHDSVIFTSIPIPAFRSLLKFDMKMFVNVTRLEISQFLYPITQKVAGYYIIPSELFECPSVSASFPGSNLSIFWPNFFKLCIGIDIWEEWYGIANGLISFRNNRVKVQVHDQIFFAKDCMPCNRLCRNCSCYWSIFRRCLSLNKGLPL